MPVRKYEPKSRGRPFALGNPGKPRGARHRTTLAVEKLLDGEAEGLTRKAIDLALAGDTVALRLCLERVAPLRKGRPVAIALPDVKSPLGLVGALAAVVAAMANGQLTPDEADAVSAVIERQRRSLETLELEVRLSVIEAQLNNAQGA